MPGRSSPRRAMSSARSNTASICLSVEYGPPGAIARGGSIALASCERLTTTVRSCLVDRDDGHAGLGDRVVGAAGADLVVLGRVGERPLPARVDLLAADLLEQPDRLGVLVGQLLGRLVAAVEERPPRRLGLARVIAGEREHQPLGALLGRVVGFVVGQSGEQRRRAAPRCAPAAARWRSLGSCGGSGASSSRTSPNFASASGRRARSQA